MYGALQHKLDSHALDDQLTAPLLDRGVKFFPIFLRVLL